MKITLSLLAVLTGLVLSASASADGTLAGWWRLDEGAGTVVHDSSGNGNTGTLSSPAAWVNGYFGTAVAVDGSTTRVSIPDSPSLEPESAVTVAAWMKADGPQGTYKYLIAKGASACLAASYGLYTGPTGRLTFYVTMRGAAFTRSPAASPAIWDGNWHFVVGSYDGSVVRLYVDGAQIGAGSPATGAISYRFPNNDMFIGHYAGCTNHDFKGTIDEPQVFNGALSPAQVLSSYNVLVSDHAAGGSTPGTPPPAPPPSQLPRTAPPKLSHVSLGGLARGKPRLSMNVSPGKGAPRLKSVTVKLPSGLGITRRLRQLRAGVKVAHAGPYKLALRPANFTITFKHPARGVSVTAALPALTERASLRNRVERFLRHGRARRTANARLVLTLALGVSDAQRHRFHVVAHVKPLS